jgi:hypothetical protein
MRNSNVENLILSRSIILPLQQVEMKTLVDKGIPLYVTDEMKYESSEIQALLLRFRLENWKERISLHEKSLVPDHKVPSYLLTMMGIFGALSVENDPLAYSRIGDDMRMFHLWTLENGVQDDNHSDR